MTSKVFFCIGSLIVLSMVSYSGGRNLPSYIKPCKRSDPKLEKCLINLIDGLKPRLSKGITEMHLPPLDPFYLPEIKLNQGQASQSVNFEAAFKNIVAEGGKKFNLTNLKLDFKNTTITINVTFPKISMDADYDINGKILLVPIKGKGKSTGTFTDIKSSIVIQAKHEKKNGKTYFVPKTRKVSLELGGLKIHFDNLFNGNKELSESTNKFINENWREIIQEINPLVEDTLGEIMLQMTKGLMELYSLEELIPES